MMITDSLPAIMTILRVIFPPFERSTVLILLLLNKVGIIGAHGRREHLYIKLEGIQSGLNGCNYFLDTIIALSTNLGTHGLT